MITFWKAADEGKSRSFLIRDWLVLAGFLLGGFSTPGAGQSSGSIASLPSAQLVGDLSDPACIEFEGNSSFSSAQLRYSILFHERFQEASHPSAPLEGLLNTVRDEMLSGYQRNGFPDVRVAVGLVPPRDRIEVKTDEGPHLICGGVTVTGAEKPMTRFIVSCLTNAPPDADSDESLHWQPGQPARFDSYALRSIENVLRGCLAGRGWFFPKIALHVERTSGSPLARLAVDVSSLGPPGKIMELEVQGNRKNSGPAILKFLGLKRGATITSDEIAAAEKKLLNSGRVLQANIEPQMLIKAEDQPKGVRLLVRIDEYSEAPRIDEALTLEQKALLRVCRWLSNFANCSEDAVVSFEYACDQSPTGYAGKMILSAREGALVRVRSRGTAPVDSGYAFVLRPGAVGLYPPGHRAKFVLELAGLDLSPTICLSVTPNPPGSGDPFSLSVSLGSNWESNDSPTNAPTGVPMVHLNLLPSAFLYLGEATNSICTIRNGVLNVSDSSSVLKADARTGRLQEFAYRGTDATVNVKFQAGALAEAVGQLDAEPTARFNSFDPRQPAASLVGFLMRELAFSYLSGQVTTNGQGAKLDPRAVQVVNRLLATQVFAPLDKTHSEALPAGAFFWIPKDDADRQFSQQGYNIWLYNFLERFGRGCFPADSWTWHLMLDSAALLNRQSTNAVNDLNALSESVNIGPVGCFAAGYVASRFSLPVYREFAAKGLQLQAAFPVDYSLLLSGDSGLALCFAQFAATLRQLPTMDVDALASALPSYEGLLLTQAYWALRSSPGQSLSFSLGPVLDDYWSSVLGPKFHAGFECTLIHP